MEKKNFVNYGIVLAGMFILSAVLLAVMSAFIWKTGAVTDKSLRMVFIDCF